MATASSSTSPAPAPDNLFGNTGVSYNAAQLITVAAHAVLNTVFVAPTPKPAWFDDLDAQLKSAQQLAGQWVDTLGPEVTKTIPLQVINFGANFTAATNAILQIVQANPQAQGANDPSVVQIKAIIQQTLLPPLQTVIGRMTEVSSALTTWGDSMQRAHNSLATGATNVQAAQIALQGDIAKMNAAIDSLHTEIDSENRLIAYSAAAIGIGILALVVGIALAPETGGVSLLVGGFIGVAGIIGGSVTWGIMQSKINDQFDQIAKDTQERTDDERQIIALKGLQLATQNAVSSIEMATSTLSKLQTQWGTFQGELLDVVTQLESAEQSVSAIVQGVFTSAVQTEWSAAIATANNLVNGTVQIQTQTVPMAAAA